MASCNSQQGRPGGGGRGVGRHGAGLRGQLQPAGAAAHARPDQQEEGGKCGYRERVDDAGDE